MSLYNKGLSSQRHQNRVIFHKENPPKIVKKISILKALVFQSGDTYKDSIFDIFHLISDEKG